MLSGSGGFGSGRSSVSYTSVRNGNSKDRYGWRVGGGGGAGGYIQGAYMDYAINKLFTISVGGGGAGSLSDGNGGVTAQQNKGANSSISIEGDSDPIALAYGGGIGCMDIERNNTANGITLNLDDNYDDSQGGSCGGRFTGFHNGRIVQELGVDNTNSQYGFYQTQLGYYLYGCRQISATQTGHHQSVGTVGKPNDGVTTSFASNPGSYTTIYTEYGVLTGRGNPGGTQNGYITNINSGEPYFPSLGGGGAGSAPTSYSSFASNSSAAYGGQAREWPIDGSYYAAGGGGATVDPNVFDIAPLIDANSDITIQKYGTGGGRLSTDNNTSHSDVYGGSGIRITHAYVSSSQVYDERYAFMYAGYDNTYASYQNNISRDGVEGTGSGGGGGFAHTINESDDRMYHSGSTSNTNFESVFSGQTNQTIYEGFNGSGGSGRVKIAIPKQINGVDVIASIETGYTGT